MDESRALVILRNIPHFDRSTLRSYLIQYGSAVDVVKILQDAARQDSLPNRLRQEETCYYLSNVDKQVSWQEDLCLVEKKRVELVGVHHNQYPKQLLSIKDPPAILYVCGDVSFLKSFSIALVGTRNATPYGLSQAAHFARHLAFCGVCIVSGLARGIDTCAHCACLDKGATLAVIGSGLANIYPRENQELSEKITRCGALVSEYPMKMPPARFHFPDRNRIVSALSSAILLVEAPTKSGALLTMEHGFNQGKKLYALAGRSGEESFGGNHVWIKNRQADLIDTPDELIRLLNFKQINLQFTAQQSRTRVCEDPLEKKIIELLRKTELTLDELSHLLDHPLSKLQVKLTILLITRDIVELPGKRYRCTTI